MTRKNTKYCLNENDKQLINDVIRKANTKKRQKVSNRNFGGAPGVLFGIVQADWEIGDTIISVLPARFDNFTSNLSGTEAIDIYVNYHQYPRYVDAQLSQNAVVPYIPFQGEDKDGIKGILAGELIARDYNPFGAVYTKDGTKPAITLNNGLVNYASGSASVGNELDTVYPLDVDKYFWVEIVVTPIEDGTPTVTIDPTIQADSTAPEYWNVSAGGVLTWNYPIGWIDGDLKVFYQQQVGDIDLKTLYTPGYNTDIQGGDINVLKTTGMKSFLNSLDDKTYFFEGREILMQTVVGELAQYTLGDVVKWGGTDQDGTLKHTDDIELNVENKITHKRKGLTYDVDHGLLQEFLDANIADIIIEALGKWVGIEQGGVFKHLNSPVDSVSHPDHFGILEWIPGTGSINWTPRGQSTISVTNLKVYIDRTGHIWRIEVNGTDYDQPQPTLNYRYVHCSDPSTYPDRVYAASQGTTVVLDNDQCYRYVGRTELATTGTTITNTYADCETCEGALTNEQWVLCGTSTNAAVLSPGHTTVEKAWLCIGGVWTKCEFSHFTATVATDPAVLLQCGLAGAPTNCNQLVGWPASDDFGGTGCNSGAVGDTNWGFRWINVGSGGASISSEKLNHSVSPSNDIYSRNNGRDFLSTGDFLCKVNHVVSGQDTDTQMQLEMSIGSIFVQVGIYQDKWFTRIFPGSNVYHGTNNASSLFEISRSGSTVSLKIDGVTKASTTESGSVSDVRIMSFANGVSTASCTWDNFILEDGSGNNLYIDPTGKACP